MMFRKKPIAALEQARRLIEGAMAIVWQHQKIKTFMPKDEDFAMLAYIHGDMMRAQREVDYIAKCLYQRSEGRGENSEARHFDFWYMDYDNGDIVQRWRK